jgi:subtilisin-like proprotein convertase family protein
MKLRSILITAIFTVLAIILTSPLSFAEDDSSSMISSHNGNSYSKGYYGEGHSFGDSRYLYFKVADFDPLIGEPPFPAARKFTAYPEDRKGYYIVQFTGIAQDAWKEQLSAKGVSFLKYIPENGFIINTSPNIASEIKSFSFVRWIGILHPAYKISPEIGQREFKDADRVKDPRFYLTVDLFPHESLDETAENIIKTGAEVLQIEENSLASRMSVRAHDFNEIEKIAKIYAVKWIEEIGEITKRNNLTRWVIQTNQSDVTSIWDHGLKGEGQIGGLIDDRMYMNSCYFEDPVDNTPGPSHRKVVAYRSSTGQGSASHGTHTAGTIAGDQEPINGTIHRNGNAYKAKISFGNLSDITGSGTSPSNLAEYLTLAHNDGARLHSNSWGDDGTTAYTTWSRDIDDFNYQNEESLVLFAVTNTSSLRTPENAKNVLAVGATSQAPSQHNHCTGGTGPTNDGRRKPEIYAPGCGIYSARNSAACDTRSMSGTSMACPAVAGAGLLVRQYYTEGWYPTGTKNSNDALTPTGALIKATLINSAVDLTGVSGYPSNKEGWGRTLLENSLFFEGDSRTNAVLQDLRNIDGLSTGEELTYQLIVNSSNEDLRITLVWTEPPADLMANPAYINNLDLEVITPSDVSYLGNFFNTSTGYSQPGGTPDEKNNVEQVHLSSPEAGTYTITVKGTIVNEGTQGFALFATGDVTPTTGAYLKYFNHSIDDSGAYGNSDGIAGPGETIIMPVTLENIGTDNAIGISSILRSDSPNYISITDRLADFPDIAKGETGTSLSPHYEFSIDPDTPCGTQINMTLSISADRFEGDSTFPVYIGRIGDDFPSADTPLTIPKKTTGIVSSINVPDAFTVNNVTASVDVSHSDIGEIQVILASPAGTEVYLHNRSKLGTKDINTIYDTLTLPDGPGTMDDFNGEQGQGSWTLKITDSKAGKVRPGTLNSWTLHLEATTPYNCTPFDCGEPKPPSIGDALRLSKESSTDLRLSWDPVTGASDYRVWKSPLPDFSDEIFVGVTNGGATFLIETDALNDPISYYYKVRAINSCNQEGS